MKQQAYFAVFFFKKSQNIFRIDFKFLYLCRIWYKMTEEDKKVISTFEGKLRHFLFLYEELKQENASLKHLLLEKEEEISHLKQHLKESEAQYADLKTARTISLFDKDIKETKQRLSRLVREIDKCIALLNG